MDQLEAALLGVAAAVAAVLLMNLWPSFYRWGDVITSGKGRSGGRMYSVRFGRWRDTGKAEGRASRFIRRKFLKGPIDASFHARVAIIEHDSNGDVRREKVVPIPVDKSWRPTVNPGIILSFAPERCDRELLRTFPPEIRAKRDAEQLSLDDFLEHEGATLRLYAFCYRRFMGTRFVKQSEYTREDLKRGSHRNGRFVPAAADALPRRVGSSDLKERAFDFGSFRVTIARRRRP